MIKTTDNNAIVEEHFLRAYRLWTQRHIPIAWPIEPMGYTFLGNAVHLVGAALFPNWTGEEPAEFQLPALEEGTFQEASENKRLFAKAILCRFDAAAVCDDGRSEMSIAEWKRAIDLYAMNLLPNIAAVRRKMAVLMRTMIEAAAHKKLSMATRTSFGMLVPSRPSEWTTEWAYPRFAECQMNPALPFTNTHPPVLFGTNLPGTRIDLLPGNQWIFVETKSLEAFLSEISVGRDAGPDTNGNGSDQPERLPATIKQEIKVLLFDIIGKWNQGGRAADLYVGKEKFAKLARDSISGAKLSWGTKIWLDNRPEEWAKRGPR